jgi:hypothetical protein
MCIDKSVAAESAQEIAMSEPAAGARLVNYAPAPRWVKVLGGVVAAIVLLMAILMLTGHGPGRHFGAGPSPINPAGDGAASDIKK